MNTIWDTVLEHVKSRMNPSSFNTWFFPTKQLSFQNNILRIAVPDKYFVNWLEEHYMEIILEILRTLTGATVEVRFVIDEELGARIRERQEDLFRAMPDSARLEVEEPNTLQFPLRD